MLKYLRIAVTALSLTACVVIPACSSEETTTVTMIEQAVIAYFDYEGDDLKPLFALEDRLEAAIAEANVGEYDGHDIHVDLTDGMLYMYGPDAEALFAVVRPILSSAACLRNVRVTVRFGPPEDGTPERMESLP
jgi:hypothetical protein